MYIYIHTCTYIYIYTYYDALSHEPTAAERYYLPEVSVFPPASAPCARAARLPAQ